MCPPQNEHQTNTAKLVKRSQEGPKWTQTSTNTERLRIYVILIVRLPQHWCTPGILLLMRTASPLGCGGLRFAVSMRGGPSPRVLDEPFIILHCFSCGKGFAPSGGGYAETADTFGPPPCWVLFRTFSQFFAFVFAFWAHLKPSCFFFFDFPSILEGFWEDFGTILGRFFDDFSHFP